MIRAERKKVVDLERAALTENSQYELSLPGAYVSEETEVEVFYDDDKLLLAVVVVPPKSFLQPAEIFLLVGKAFSPRYIRQTAIGLRKIADNFCGLRTCVNVDFRRGCRFAEFLGFRSRGEPFEHAGHRFQLYEVYV